MHAYSIVHQLWLVAIVISSVVLAFVSRQGGLPRLIIRIGLAVLLAGGELQHYFKDGLAFPDRVPLHVCNVATWVGVIACVTLSPTACEFAYFWGIIGAGMALMTPDMGALWPPRFFINHGAMILTAITLGSGGIMRIRRGAIGRAYGWFAFYIGLVGLYNWRFGTNFAFVAHKPTSPTLMDFLGPWPLYLVSEAALGVVLLYLLWFPLRRKTETNPLVATQNVHWLEFQQPMDG